MTKRILLVFALFYFLVPDCMGQKSTLTGKVIDSVNYTYLQNVSIVLLQAKDSFIVADTRTAKDGSFTLSNVGNGSYILMLTSPGFVDYSKAFNINSNSNTNVVNFKDIGLYSKAIFLKEVLIKDRVATIKIKGDTTEFKVDKLKLRANATVEELLKQLPSIQIDQSGNITAQGKRVKNVLVDGEEFFGNDPLLVTRNLRADMIGAVQVYDKKSEAATFTGINDGVKNKTINLKLKENKKSGYFGKAVAGAGNDGYYSAQGMFNLFQNKKKFAVYVTTGNIGQSGLAKEDKDRFGSDESGDGTYDGKGIPKITSGGAHFDQRWDDDKKSINANVKINANSITNKTVTSTENNLPTGIQLSDQTNTSSYSGFRHQYNFTYINKPNPKSTLQVYMDASIFNTNGDDASSYNSRTGNEIPLVKNNTDISYRDNYNIFNLNLDWQRKLKKDGQTFSAYFKSSYSKFNSNGYSFKNYTFFDPAGIVDSARTLDLKRINKETNNTIDLSFIYTQKLFKNVSMILNYNLNNRHYDDNGSSYDTVGTGSYGHLNNLFSNRFITNQLTNKGGLALNYAYKQLIIKIGSNVGHTNFKMTNDDNEQLKKDYTIFEPGALMTLRFTDNRTLEFNYNGYTSLPDKAQLQPSRYINDLLNTYLPNPYLRSSFTNSLNLTYSQYNTTAESYFSLTGGYSVSANPIVSIVDANPTGTFIYHFENLLGYNNKNFSFNAQYSRKIKSINSQFFIIPALTSSKNFSRINNQLNSLNTNNYNVSFGLSKNVNEVYNLSLSAAVGKNINKFSVRKDFDNNYLYFSSNPSADVFIKKKLQLHTDASYIWQEKTRAFDKNFDRFVWNAWIGRTFLKNEQLLIKIGCNDILNRNVGFNRSATDSYITQSTYKTIQRFFLVSAVWNFSHFNTTK